MVRLDVNGVPSENMAVVFQAVGREKLQFRSRKDAENAARRVQRALAKLQVKAQFQYMSSGRPRKGE